MQKPEANIYWSIVYADDQPGNYHCVPLYVCRCCCCCTFGPLGAAVDILKVLCYSLLHNIYIGLPMSQTATALAGRQKVGGGVFVLAIGKKFSSVVSSFAHLCWFGRVYVKFFCWPKCSSGCSPH